MTKRRLENWLTSYMKFVENTEPPYLFHYWTAMSTIAACLQRKCKLSWGTITFYPNLYVVLVAPSGKARKGTALNIGYSMLRTMGIKMAAEAITREALIRTLKDANNADVDPITGRITLHSSLTIFSMELTVFLGYNNQQLMSDLTDWYDCRERWTYRTKNMGTDDISGVWVNLIGATTPELIQATMPLTAIGGGLTSRIIFVFEERKRKIVPLPFLSAQEEQLGEDLLHDLQQIHSLRGEFKCDEEFANAYAEWYIQQENNPPFEDEKLKGYCERRPNHIMKTSMIMSAARSDEMIIRREDFERARELLERTERKMIFTFRGMGTEAKAAIAERLMGVIGAKKTVKYSELLYMFRSDLTKWHLDRLLEGLVEMKFCKVQLKATDTIITYVGEHDAETQIDSSSQSDPEA